MPIHSEEGGVGTQPEFPKGFTRPTGKALVDVPVSHPSEPSYTTSGP